MKSAAEEGQTQREKSANAKAAALVALIGMDTEGNELPQEISAGFRRKALRLISAMETRVTSSSSEFQWRAVELAQFAQAYSCLLDAGGGSDELVEMRLKEFAIQAESQLKSILAPKNNLSLKLAGALGLAALTLERSLAPEIRIDSRRILQRAVAVVEDVLWNCQSRDGGRTGYSEGPYYFRYAMMSLLPFFLALEQRNERYPDDPVSGFDPMRDARFLALYDWASGIRMPDGRLPAVDDTYMDSAFPELAVLAFTGPRDPRYAWPIYGNPGRALTADQLAAELNGTHDFRSEYLLAGARPQAHTQDASGHFLSTEAGYAVLHPSCGPDNPWLALIGKNGSARTHNSPFGAGHKQANEGAFILHAGGELLVSEPGYSCYEQRDSVMFGRNHNVVLVDGKGADSVGFGSAMFGADAFIEDAVTTAHFGTASVRSAYQNAEIERHAMLFSSGVAVLVDEASSNYVRTYTQQIHGMGSVTEGTCIVDTAAGTALWTIGGMTLRSITRTIPDQRITEAAQKKHAPRYRAFEPHTAAYNSVRDRAAVFLTMLLPAGRDECVRMEGAPPGDGCAVRVSGGAVEAAAAVAAEGIPLEIRAGPFRISTEARFAAAEAIPGSITAWMKSCRSLSINDTVVLVSVPASDILYRRSGNILEISANAPREVEIEIPGAFTAFSVEGKGARVGPGAGGGLCLHADAGIASLRITLESGSISAAKGATSAAGVAVAALFPNPFIAEKAGAAVCRVTLPPRESGILRITDPSGRVRFERRLEKSDVPDRIVRIDAAGLPSGIYILSLLSGRHSDKRKFLIL